MLGGFALNISGPCYRPIDIIKLQFDEITVDCERVSDGFPKVLVHLPKAIFR